MNAQSIGDTINEKVRNTAINGKSNLQLSEKYPYWIIGITNNLDRRKNEHFNNGKNVELWRGWPADTEGIARDVEAHFIKYGMKGGEGGGQNPTYVYIF